MLLNENILQKKKDNLIDVQHHCVKAGCRCDKPGRNGHCGRNHFQTTTSEKCQGEFWLLSYLPFLLFRLEIKGGQVVEYTSQTWEILTFPSVCGFLRKRYISWNKKEVNFSETFCHKKWQQQQQKKKTTYVYCICDAFMDLDSIVIAACRVCTLAQATTSLK